MQQFIIVGRLPALNDYVRANRANKYMGNSMKNLAMEQAAWAIKTAKIKPISGPVKVTFHWYEENRKRDLDNICFARKFILDALQPCTQRNTFGQGILAGDGWKHIAGFSDSFSVDKNNPRVVVRLICVGDVCGK